MVFNQPYKLIAYLLTLEWLQGLKCRKGDVK